MQPFGNGLFEEQGVSKEEERNEGNIGCITMLDDVAVNIVLLGFVLHLRRSLWCGY